MNKYLKVSLVLTSICLGSALGVAGINYITAPEIARVQAEKEAEAFLKIFPDLDTNNSKVISTGFKSSYVTKRLDAYDASGNLLGYAFSTRGTNQYGAIALTVGFKADGTLLKVVVVENTQSYADKMGNFDQKFTEGMTQDDVMSVPVASGATFGSNLMKNQISACFAELGTYTEIQQEIIDKFGDSVDFSKTIVGELYYFPQQVVCAYKVKNSNGKVLGYFHKIVVNDVVYTVIHDGNELREVLVNKEVVTSEDADLAARVAKANIDRVFDENIAVELAYGKNVTLREKDFEKNTSVEKHLEVLKGEEVVGSLIYVKGSTAVPGTPEATIGLVVSINKDDKLNGVFIYENNQTAGRDIKISSFIGNNFFGEMTGDEAMAVDTSAGATLGSNLVLDLIADAFKEATGEKPEKPNAGNDYFYEQAFANVDISKKKVIEDIDNDKVLEGVELFDSNNNSLGKAFIIKDENQYGHITMMVSVKNDGSLGKAIYVENGQSYADKMPGYDGKFTEGMTSADIDGVPAASGATFGSNLTKSIIKLALSLGGGAYNSYYTEIFADIDLTKSEALKSFKNKDVITGLIAKDKDGNVLGSLYVVKVENQYSKNIVLVGLDKNGNFKAIKDIENTHSPIDGSKFEEGFTFDQIKDAALTGASYSSDMARQAILIAMTENMDGTNEEILYGSYARDFFPNMLSKYSTPIINFTNKGIKFGDTNVNVIYGLDIRNKDYKKADNILGKLYIVTVESKRGTITIAIGINSNGTIAGVNLISTSYSESSVMGNTLPQKIDEYLQTFVGKNINYVRAAGVQSSASYASLLAKLAVETAFAEYDNAKVIAKDPTKNDALIYLSAIKNVDFDITKSEISYVGFKDKSITSKLVMKNSDGTIIGYAYITKVDMVYSENYIMVVLDANGNFDYFFDVENNHGSIEGQYGLFEGCNSLDDIMAVQSAGASFTVEQMKLAARIVMNEHKSTVDNTIKYELAIKKLFPYVVMHRSIIVNQFSNSAFKYGIRAIGVDPTQNFANNISLGTAFVFEANGKEYIVSYKSIKQGWSTKVVVDNFLDIDGNKVSGIEVAGKTKDEINQLNIDSTIKSLLIEGFAENELISEKTPYDNYVLAEFSNMNLSKSNVINSFKSKEIISGLEVKDTNGSLLGYAYILKLSNAYTSNVILVTLDADFKYKNIVDISNTHAAISNAGFVPGSDLNTIKQVTQTGGSYTFDMSKTAIIIAMSEAKDIDTSQIAYENAAKSIFPYMVSMHSKYFTEGFVNKEVGYKIEVRGTSNYQNNQLLGYAYLVEYQNGDYTVQVMVGIDAKGNFAGATLISCDANKQIVAGGDNYATKLQSYYDSLKGLSARAIIEAEYNETFVLGGILAKNTIAIAFAENNKKVVESLIENKNFDFAFEKAYNNVNINMSEKITSDNKDILAARTLRDYKGNFLGNAYVVRVDMAYSHNYIMVILNKDGTFQKIYDVDNNHGDLAAQADVFKNGMSYEEISNTHITSSSFTVEQIRIAIRIVMGEKLATPDVNLKYERVAKEHFPYLVMDRSVVYDDKAIINDAITFGLQARGVKYYQTNSLLGYMYVINKNGHEIAISFDEKLKVQKAVSLNDTSINEFLNKFNGLDKESASKVDGNDTIKELVLALYDEAEQHLELTAYDKFIYSAYADVNAKNSIVISNVNNAAIIKAVALKDASNDDIATVYIEKVQNPYTKNTVMVCVRNDGSYDSIYDIENDHSPIDNKFFNTGSKLEDINNKANGATGSTYTIDLTRTAIVIALTEYSKNASQQLEVAYELYAKQLFPYLVMNHSKVTKEGFNNKAVSYKIEVRGSYNYQNNQLLGYTYVVESNGKKVMVAFDSNNANKVSVFDINNQKIVDDKDLSQYEELINIAKSEGGIE